MTTLNLSTACPLGVCPLCQAEGKVGYVRTYHYGYRIEEECTTCKEVTVYFVSPNESLL